VVAQPVGAGSLALGIAGFPFMFATVRAVAYLLLAGTLGLQTAHANWAGVVVVLLAAAPAMTAIGIVLAAVALVASGVTYWATSSRSASGSCPAPTSR